MALYDYRCKKCGETFEVRQKYSDAPLTVHDGCGGEVQRLVSAPALQFKGTGWYVTDYAKNGKSPSTTPKAESKSEGAKTESKPESKSESKSEPAKSSSTEKK